MKFRRSAVAALASLTCLCVATFASPGDGLSTPVKLRAYEASRPPCRAPSGLQKKLVFVQDNRREFMQGAGRGIEAAARARGLNYSVAFANNDPALMIKQVVDLTSDKTGAIIVAPIDPPTLAPTLKNLIGAGAYVGAIVPPPATTVLNAPQYLTGKALAEAAASYIRDRHGRKAKVVLLTHDSLQFLAPRFTAIRDVLRNLPGVTIVADISPATVDRDGGYRMMKTILLAQPDIDVVLGADTVVLGALAALREAGKARPDQFLGGIDGEQEAVIEIKKGDSPFKVSISLASSIFGYAMGQQAADWLEGKSIPQAMDILPMVLTRSNIADYERDTADPGAVYADESRRAAYLKMYGNTCFDTRENYINFPWSSEAK